MIVEYATLVRARTAVGWAFAVNGLAFASWASRTPAIRDALSLSPAELGLLLLCLSGGAVTALPLSGPIVHRLGAPRAVLPGALGATLGLLGLAVGLATTTVQSATIGLALAGTGMGLWDVAMNVEGAAVERRLGRSVMPGLHAAFSLGTVVGAGVGATSAVIGIPVAAQVAGTACVVLVSMSVAVRAFLRSERPAAAQHSGAGVLAAWREPRTLLIGLLALAFTFTEGSANDWLAVALVDGHELSETMGAVGFGCFVSAMTVGRLAGGRALARFGRVTVLRTTAAFALVGLLLALTGPSLGWVLAGALLWGAGASLGFPIAMSAAADDPERAAVRVSVVSSIGYTSFLAGPPLIGILAERTGILQALFVVVGAVGIGLLTSGSSRPLTAPVASRRGSRRSGGTRADG